MSQAAYLYTRIREALPWSGGDPNVKGDPRKSVKWIDVRALGPSSLSTPQLAGTDS